jgi:hypothetical protein
MLAEFIRSWPDVSREMVLGAICSLCTGEPRESKEHHLGVRPVELLGVCNQVGGRGLPGALPNDKAGEVSGPEI